MTSNVIVVTILIVQVTISKATVATTLGNIFADPKLNFTGLATKAGLPSEEYDVTTEDGYILKMFNVPGNKTKPVLIMHGMADSADTYILRGRSSIVYLLSKEGYDVWLSNYRGNRYSRRHVTLNPDTDAAFWDFSMHEHGLYDLATSIDFILNNTEASRLSLIGYSEGTVIMFILGSLRPEYNDKVSIFMAWTPICYLHNALSKVNPLMLPGMHIYGAILRGLKIEELMEYNSIFNVITNKFCAWYPEVCIFFLHNGAGWDGGGIEPAHLNLLTAYYPSGTSRKNMEHYFQVMLSRRFAQFDYGAVKNLAKYNSRVPPIYDLRKVTVNIALFMGKYDKVSTQEDVAVLRKQLPNVVFYGTFDDMSHITFTQSKFSPKIVYPTVFRLLKEYS